LGIGNIKTEIDKLTTLPIKVITTHAHWDHIGGHSMFNMIYIHEEDLEWLKNGIPLPIDIVKSNIKREPFSKTPPKEFDINNYTIYTSQNVNALSDNHIIDIGLRKVKILHTPGHSPGHICIWEQEKGYLFTGDLIYSGTLYAFYPSTDPIKFKQSIDRISQLKNITKVK
jgi:glyoxylase-like metal-dependent hydrolase (beta-lactamase superfamily II)